jgi:TatD DNase family protein
VLIDSHAHLSDKKFYRDLDRVLARASDAGVERIVSVADSAESSRKCVALAHRHGKVYATVGIHPHQARHADEARFEELATLSEDPRVVAVGEVGLDYHYRHSDPEVQATVFRRQIDLAREVGLPLVVHCRDAFGDLLKMLRAAKAEAIGGVVHCFSGDSEAALEIVDMGWYIGIGGPLTFPHAEALRETVRSTPLERILLETDSPYLPPQVKRGWRNEPSYLRHVLKALADVKGLSFQEAARIAKSNTARLFNLAFHVSPEVAYSLRRSLYLNITNRCTNRCIFCFGRRDFMWSGYNLQLDHEPTREEIDNRLEKQDRFEEVVFCGLGEPTMRLGLLLEIARHLKERGQRVRLNTNGQGSLTNGKDITPNLAGLFDTVSISLNAATAEDYNHQCRPEDPEHAFEAILEFAGKVKKVVPEVDLTVVGAPKVDIEACRVLAEEKLGIPLRVREYLAPPKYEIAQADDDADAV